MYRREVSEHCWDGDCRLCMGVADDAEPCLHECHDDDNPQTVTMFDPDPDWGTGVCRDEEPMVA
jgi:hypothetical protein